MMQCEVNFSWVFFKIILNEATKIQPCFQYVTPYYQWEDNMPNPFL
jgi:hypothetical protein